MFVLDENVKPDIKAELPACQGILVSVPASRHVIIYRELLFSLSEINHFSSLP